MWTQATSYGCWCRMSPCSRLRFSFCVCVHPNSPVTPRAPSSRCLTARWAIWAERETWEYKEHTAWTLVVIVCRLQMKTRLTQNLKTRAERQIVAMRRRIQQRSPLRLSCRRSLCFWALWDFSCLLSWTRQGKCWSRCCWVCQVHEHVCVCVCDVYHKLMTFFTCFWQVSFCLRWRQRYISGCSCVWCGVGFWPLVFLCSTSVLCVSWWPSSAEDTFSSFISISFLSSSTPFLLKTSLPGLVWPTDNSRSCQKR